MLGGGVAEVVGDKEKVGRLGNGWKRERDVDGRRIKGLYMRDGDTAKII